MSQITAIVTGGTGFVGSRLVLALLTRGARVRILSSNSTTRDRTLGLDGQVTWDDITDAAIDRAARDATHFFNFAVVYDRPSIDDETLKAVNVDLPLRVIERLRARDTGTTCVLGDSFFRKFPFEATRQPRYTKSKATLALRLRDLMDGSDREGIRVAMLQIEQIYGPGESFSKVFPLMARQLLENTPRIALTHGRQRRDFIHVDDVVAAALTVADTDWRGLLPVECGTGTSTPVRHVLERLKALTKSTSVLGFGDLPPDQSIDDSVADIGWLRSRGWNPRVPLERGLAELVEDVSLRLRSAPS